MVWELLMRSLPGSVPWWRGMDDRRGLSGKAPVVCLSLTPVLPAHLESIVPARSTLTLVSRPSVHTFLSFPCFPTCVLA